MKTIRKIYLVVICALMLTTSLSALVPFSKAQRTVRVGSLRADRVSGGSLFEFAGGWYYDAARAELADPNNFGPGGVVECDFVILPAVHDITLDSLSDVDIFWAALLANDDPLSTDEQQGLLDFVKGGGSLVVIADVGWTNVGPNSVAAPFDVHWDGTSWVEANPTITDTLHPIIDGPFGQVETIGHASEGSIGDLGPHASAIASNVNGTSIAWIEPGSLGLSAGAIFFFSDVNTFTSNDTPWGSGFDRFDNRILFRNLFAYLCAIAPSRLEDALHEMEDLLEYVQALYDDEEIDDYKYNRITTGLMRAWDRIEDAIEFLDTERLGFDDLKVGMDYLYRAVQELDALVKDVWNWVQWGRMPSELAEGIIEELGRIEMKLYRKARAEAEAERMLAVAAIMDAEARGRHVPWLWSQIEYIDQLLLQNYVLPGFVSRDVGRLKLAFYYSQRVVVNAWHWSWHIPLEDWVDQLEASDSILVG